MFARIELGNHLGPVIFAPLVLLDPPESFRHPKLLTNCMSADSTKTLLFESSPFGTIDAIVEHDGRVVYFYLNEHPNAEGKTPGRFGTRACWVRNLQRGPLVLDKSDQSSGLAPLMPRNDCLDSDPQHVPAAESLEIVWFEEGNGAALVETTADSKQTIAVIPPWSGIDGFHGYALGCVHETPLAWPMPVNEALQLRVDRAAEFWSSFTAEDSPFAKLQPQLVAGWDQRFGKENQKRYYAIDGGQFPPRGLVHYETNSETILLTVGMSLCSQPAVELAVDSPSELRRIELGTKIPHAADGPETEFVEATIGSMSSWAGYPWRNHSWLGNGHTIDWSVAKSKATLVIDTKHDAMHFRNDPIQLLWIEVQR